MRRLAWPLLALATAVGALPARAGGSGRSVSGIRWEEGSRAPADAWLEDDGCPARTGATETAPLTGPREVAWRMSVAGEVEGEPLAFGGKVFVVERAGAKAILHVLLAATGVERYRQAFDCSLPLAPCVDAGRILLRASPRALQGFTVGEKALALRWTLSAKAAVGPPAPVYWMHQLGRAAPRELRLDGEEFMKAVNGQLRAEYSQNWLSRGWGSISFLNAQPWRDRAHLISVASQTL